MNVRIRVRKPRIVPRPGRYFRDLHNLDEEFGFEDLDDGPCFDHFVTSLERVIFPSRSRMTSPAGGTASRS